MSALAVRCFGVSTDIATAQDTDTFITADTLSSSSTNSTYSFLSKSELG
jgi:hypothetical protein